MEEEGLVEEKKAGEEEGMAEVEAGVEMEAGMVGVGEADQKEEEDEEVVEDEATVGIELNSVHHRIGKLCSDNLVCKISITFVDYLLILHATLYEYNGNLYHIIHTALTR